jgi:aryl-alcohol dehydrogenase-like predicted oxidoreductase
VQVADVSKLAEERSITAAQLSLAWVASQVSFTRRGHETKRSDAIRDRHEVQNRPCILVPLTHSD